MHANLNQFMTIGRQISCPWLVRRGRCYMNLDRLDEAMQDSGGRLD